MIAALRRITNAARTALGKRPEAGRAFMPHRDQFGNLFTGELTWQRVERLLRGVLDGEAEDIAPVYDRMMFLDDHIRAERGNRLAATQRLAWEIISATPLDQDADDFNEDLARRVASYCRRIINRMHGFDAMLRHLAVARANGLVAAEIEWASLGGKRLPVAAWPIEFGQLRYDDAEPWRLRIRSGGDWRGAAVDEFAPGKIVVHAPELIGGNALAGGLMLASLLWFCLRIWNTKFLMIALEKFGQPYRIGKYPDGASQATIDALIKMLEQMGASAAGVFQSSADVEMVESRMTGAGSWPHERIEKLFNAKISKLWRGATLTTEVSDSGGNRALGEVHERVSESLRDEDLQSMQETISDQFLRPLVAHEFGDEGLAHLPVFRHVIEKAEDLEKTGRLISVVVNELGAEVPARVVEEEIGISLIAGADRDAPLPGRKAGGFEFGAAVNRERRRRSDGGADGADGAGGVGDGAAGEARERLRLVANSALEKIARRRGPVARLVPWVMTASLASQAHTENVAARVMDGLALREARIVDADSAGVALAEIFETLPTDDLAELTRQTLLAGELAGRDHARRQGAARRVRVNAEDGRDARTTRGNMEDGRDARTTNTTHTTLIANAEIAFERLPFVEAIESFRARLGMDPEQFISLDAEARSRAFRVAGVWNMDLLAVMHQGLVDAFKNGESARDFRLRTAGQVFDRAGWSGKSTWHSDLVFYQNFAMSHAAGRLRQMVESEIHAWRFVATGDSCPLCTPLVGKVFAINDRRYWPPLHFWCDCATETVFDEEIDTRELLSAAGVSNPALAEYRGKASSFVFDPAQYGNLEPVALSRYADQAMRAAMADLAARAGWQVTA